MFFRITPLKFCMVYFRGDRRTGVLPAPVPWERMMKQCVWAPHRAGMWTWKATNHPLSVLCQNKRGMPQDLLFPLSWLACLKWQLFQRFNLKCVFLSWRHFVKKRIIPLWLSSENWVEFISVPLQAYKWKIKKKKNVWPNTSVATGFVNSVLQTFTGHLPSTGGVCYMHGNKTGSCPPRSQNVTRKPETVTCPQASLSKYWLY